MDLLPQELTDAIIDHLSFTNDCESIRNCAFVNKQLLIRCQYHIFFSITLNVKNIDRFFTVAQASPYNAIGRNVRELVVIAKGAYVMKGSIYKTKTKDPWIERYLPVLGECLSNLRKLEIQDSSNLRPLCFPPSGLSSVRSLVLRRCEVQDWSTYVELLKVFPSLEFLSNHFVKTRRHSSLAVISRDETQTGAIIFPSIPSLEFCSCELPSLDSFFDHLVFSLLAEPSAASIAMESFTIGPIYRSMLTSVGQFLKAAARSIKHLRISLIKDPGISTSLYRVLRDLGR